MTPNESRFTSNIMPGFAEAESYEIAIPHQVMHPSVGGAPPALQVLLQVPPIPVLAGLGNGTKFLMRLVAHLQTNSSQVKLCDSDSNSTILENIRLAPSRLLFLRMHLLAEL